MVFHIKCILNLTQQAEFSLNIKIESKRITIKGKKTYAILKKIEFLRDDINATNFINVLLGQSDKEINFYYKIDSKNTFQGLLNSFVYLYYYQLKQDSKHH
tara:strand:- start:179 stop:481 length:303 start_codon:yes stop_codon:yes gene_type:complete